MDIERVGPYRIEELLGSGGMGTVYRAWDERLGRWVAIKFIPRSAQTSDENRERLRREARAAAGLNHPSLTQVYDILLEDDRDFIVMEYVEGTPLSALFIDGPLTVDRALDLCRQIADGLAVAHGAGLVHRDLKAENILVTADDKIKILDFGVAKRVDADAGEDSLTQEGVVMGTTRAMSPEQAEGERVDRRSDLFSLGSLLYEMLTNVHPFQHSSPLETMQRVVRHRPTPVSQLNKKVPARLQTLVEKLLNKDREKRPGKAEEVSRTIEDIVNGVPERGTASETGAASAAGKRIWWKTPWFILAVALIAAGAIIAAVM